MATFIKLDRRILSWEWYEEANTFRVFVHLLLNASYKDGYWQGVAVNRGQVVVGRSKLAADLKISEQQARTCIERLISTNEITTKSTNKFTIVTICKYDTYQSNEIYNNQQSTSIITNNQPQNNQQDNQQITTFNNVNNDNKENNINNKINAGGENAAPATPASVSGLNYLPDGRSYIEPLFFYTAADFNGLPEDNLKGVLDYFDATKGIKIEPDRVVKIWSVFKTQELTNQKPYRNKDDVYRHFLNWTKKQSFAKSNNPRTTSVKKEIKTGKVIGVKFINDFSQCEMSDGAIQDLNVNQKDMARYNQINPSSIVKI